MSRRGRLSKELQEVVSVFGDRDNNGHYQKLDQKIIILPAEHAKLQFKGYTFKEQLFYGFIRPVNFFIHFGDRITRQPRSESYLRGASNGQIQVLTVLNTDNIKGQQILELEDRGIQ